MKKITILSALLLNVLFAYSQITYQYDNLNRLSQVNYPNGTSIVYTFDELGNRLSKTVGSDIIAVTGISLNKNTTSLSVGATEQLTATIAPSNATNKQVSWESNNSAVAEVSASGLVTAKQAGTATITVRTTDGNKTATCVVTVKSNETTICDNPIASGKAGDLDWALCPDGTLTISGNGVMPDYEPTPDPNPHPISNAPWFSYSNSILKIEITEGIVNIGSYAFTLCRNLNAVTIPSSVTTIGNEAFADCMNLETIIIPNSVTSIGQYAFANTNLKSVILPNSITRIEENLFKLCKNLSSITIPETVLYIGYSSFAGCSNLEEITIPKSVIEINNFAFWDCYGLKSVINNSAVPQVVPLNVFYNLDLSNVTLHVPTGTKALYQVADVWKDFGTIVDDGTSIDTNTTDKGVVINGVKWATRNVGKPGTFATNPEDAGMFYQWNRKVGWSATDPMVNSNGGTTWDNSTPVGTMWEKANDPSPAGWRVPTHEEMQKLLDINMVSNEWTNQNGVAGMRFTDKTTGKSIFFPAAGWREYKGGLLGNVSQRGDYWSSTQMYDGVVYHLGFNSSRTYESGDSPTYGDNVRSVEDSSSSTDKVWHLTPTMTATLNNAGVLTISTTASAEAMPNYIYNAGSPTVPWYESRLDIHSVIIENKVKTIGDETFTSCSNLTSIVIPSSVTSIGVRAFGWTSLASVTIPNSVTSIGDYAFATTQITSISISKYVTNIGAMPFYQCGKLSAIDVDADNPNYVSIEGVLYDKTVSALLECPENKTGNLIIPNTVVKLNDQSFNGSLLQSITIPKSVNMIGYWAFANVRKLKDLTVEWTIPLPVGEIFADPMNNIPAATLHVPDCALSAYQSAEVWKDFGTIVGDISCSTGIQDIDNLDDIVIYPNPAKSIVTIECTNIIQKIELTDLSGKLIIQKQISSSNVEISIRNQPNGIYLLNITTKNGNMVRKIVKI